VNRGRIGSNRVTQELFQITAKDAALARQPFWIPFEPAAAVAGGATATVDWQVAYRDFVWTAIGFTADTVGFPATPGRWRLTIEDVGAQKNFQPAAWDVTAGMGGNFGLNDMMPLNLPVPWVFMEKTVIRLQFTNRDPAIPGTPSCDLIGFLTNWEAEASASRERELLEIEALKRQAGQ
jgi:hypothetical protein